MNIDRALLLLNDIRVEYSTMDSLKEYVEAIDLITQELKEEILNTFPRWEE